MKRPALGAAGLFAVGVGVWFMFPTPAMSRPNVVVIVMCSVRADQLRPAGASVDPMPWLTERSTQGVWFDDAWTAAPWTRPATAAILTGQDTLSTGIADPGIEHNRRLLTQEAVTLAEHLQQAGYWTVGRSGNPNVSAAYGFDQGFDDFEYVGVDTVGVKVKTDGALLTSSLLDSLRNAPADTPRFVFGLFVDAHSPVEATTSDGAVFLIGDEPPRVGRYRAELRRLDRHLAALEQGLAEQGMTSDNTVFVVVNDHGEGLSYPVHHGRSHGFYLFPSVTKMVWTMWGRGVPVASVPSVASQVDVVPTVLDLLDMDPPTAVDGVSQRTAWSEPGSAPPRDTAFSATLFHGARRAAATSSDSACLFAFRDEDGALNTGRQGGVPFEPGCFNRRSDPTYAEPVMRPLLARELRAWWRPPASAPTVEPEGALGDALRALGYAE